MLALVYSDLTPGEVRYCVQVTHIESGTREFTLDLATACHSHDLNVEYARLTCARLFRAYPPAEYLFEIYLVKHDAQGRVIGIRQKLHP